MVELYFKDKKLGTLNNTGTFYTYDSNLENENFAKEKYFLEITKYDLYNSKNRQDVQLFTFFKDMANNIKKREDLVKLLGISSLDTEYEILTKLGKISQSKAKFYVKTVEWEQAGAHGQVAKICDLFWQNARFCVLPLCYLWWHSCAQDPQK